MSSLRSILLLGLSLSSFGLARSPEDESNVDASVTHDWKEIVRTLPGELIEAALELHLTPKYREGVFEDGHRAINAVHSDDPELASRLVNLAKQDAEVKDYLRKRQNNSTSESTTTTTNTTPITSLDTTTTAVTTSAESTPGGGSDTTPTSSSSGQSPSTAEISSTIAPPTSTSSSVEPSSAPGESAAPSASVVVSSSVVTQGGQTTTITTLVTVPASNPTSVEGSSSTADSSSAVLSSFSPSSSGEQGSPPPSASSDTGSTSGNNIPATPVPNPAPSTSSDDSTAPVASTQSGVLVPVEVSTTVGGSIIVSSSDAFETSAPTSVAVEVTSTNDQGQVIITTSIAPAAVKTLTNSQGRIETTAVPLTSVAVAPGGSIVDGPIVTSTDASGNAYALTSPIPGGVYTVTDARGLVVTVTYHPYRSTVNQVLLQTTTLPNGMRSTITSFAEVGAPTSDAQASESPSATGTPNLQSGATILSSWFAAEVALLMGAAIGAAWMVW